MILNTFKTKAYYYKLYLISLYQKFRDFLYKKKISFFLRNKNFTIISNNCWGGSIYEDLNLPYRTPTVGLFFFAPCYIKFVSNIESNLLKEISFIEYSKYEKGNILQQKNSYPIGLINDEIEIHFLHYDNKIDAENKWNRRCKRINKENIFLSFTDNEPCTMEEIKLFDSLPYRKVFFSSKKIADVKSLVWLKDYDHQDGIGNIYDDRWKYRKHFSVVKWLNKKK